MVEFVRRLGNHNDSPGRWWLVGILLTAAALASILIGVFCLLPASVAPHIPANGGHLYGLGIFLIFLGLVLLFLSLCDILKVSWDVILPEGCNETCYRYCRKLCPGLQKRDTGAMVCLSFMSLAAVILFVLGVILAASIRPFSHQKDLWVGIVFIVTAFMFVLWVLLLWTVINRPFSGTADGEGPAEGAAPAGGFTIAPHGGPYSDPEPAGPEELDCERV